MALLWLYGVVERVSLSMSPSTGWLNVKSQPLLRYIFFIMAGKISPIAALTTDDHGPIDTIVSVVLPVTSALVAMVRVTTRKRTLTQFEIDDYVFGFALVCLYCPLYSSNASDIAL